MSSDPPMKSTMNGTRCHIVAQVAIKTNPPAQFANDASITNSLSITTQRYGFYFVLSSTLLGFGTSQPLEAGSPSSIGAPASFQARHPPAIDDTLVYPIFCRLSAESAERKPPPQ